MLTAITVIYSFAACNKFRDVWYPPYQDPQREFDICRITQIHQAAGPLVPDRTGTFYYGRKGSLDSVVFDDGGIVHYWKYDDHDVLVEYRSAFNHDITDFKTLHRYAAENGKVIRDTSWSEGASGYIIAVWSLEYDNKGRVIREKGIRIDDEAPGTVLDDKVYVYDDRGNLDGRGEYDNEVSYLRTNKVLQFVHRNYSMNNPVALVLGYTPYHLPSGFRWIDDRSILDASIPTSITYSCAPIPPVGNQQRNCKLTLVKQGTETYANFYYTPEGLPLSVRYKSAKTGFDYNIHRFSYNNQGKLLRYEIFDGFYAFTWHSYGYTGNRITVDTFYTDISEQLLQVSQLQYDNIGRIIKEDIHVIEREFVPVSEFRTKQYAYDDRGNLISPLVTTYDDKVSYLRTDPLWMFIHRNYSRNNPQGATAYNGNNLPLGLSEPGYAFLDDGQPAEIQYSCGEKRK